MEKSKKIYVLWNRYDLITFFNEDELEDLFELIADLNFEEAYGNKAYKKGLREKSIEDIGYFLSPNLLYRNIISSKNYGNIIIEELDKAFTEISDSSVGRESQEDFQNLFEGVDLYASQLGKTIEDKNRVVFNILDALRPVYFDLDKESRNNTLLSKSILENRKFNKTTKRNRY